MFCEAHINLNLCPFNDLYVIIGHSYVSTDLTHKDIRRGFFYAAFKKKKEKRFA